MNRPMGGIVVTRTQALLLREAIRPLATLPFNAATLIDFCERLYEAMLDMSTTHAEEHTLVLTRDEVMIINQFVGAEDFDGSADILEQTRAALREIRTSTQVVYMARREEVEKVMEQFPLAATDDAEGGDVKAPLAQEKAE